MNDTFTQRISRILLIFFFMLAGFESFAQYTKTSLETGRHYTAIAKDQSGNVFLVRSNAGNTGYELVKYTNGTGTAQLLYSGLEFDNGIPPIGLAVNSIGDVFVTSLNSGRHWDIIKLPAPGNNTPSIIHSGDYYSVLAVDQSNNLLAIQWDGGTNYQVVKYPFGAEQLAGTIVYSGLPLPSGLSTTYPPGMVVDSHGDIYVTDFHENSGGRLIKLTAPGFGATTLATGRGFTSVAVDAADNLYTIEEVSSGVARIFKYTYPTSNGQTATDISSTANLSYSSGSHPWGLVIMPNGNIFANNGDASEVVKLAPPTINVNSITAQSPNPTAATSVTFRVTFSAAATNVTTNAFSLTTTGLTGASINTSITQISSTVYDVTVNTGTGTAGTVKLNVTGTGITPTVANAPYTSGVTYNIDRIVPTGSIVINAGALYTNTTNVTLALTANDASTPIQMAFSLDGGAYTTDETFATSKAITLPATDGLRTVTVRLKDAAGNIATYSDDITLDRQAPNTAIGTRPSDPTNLNTVTFTFTANEANCTFRASLDGGPFNLVTSPVTYTGLADGPHTFQVRAIDPAGNVDASPDGYLWTQDATGPRIISVSVPANEYYHAGQNLDFKVRYNEPAIVDQTAGTPYINIIIGLDAKQVPYIGGTGTNELTFRYTVQQGEMDMDGIQVQPLVQNNSGSIKDALGNDASTSLQNVDPTTLVRVNTSIPSVTLSFGPGVTMPTNAPFTVRAVFSEAVSGLTVSDFNVLNTTVSGLSTSDNITYNVLMTPASDGSRSISLPSGAAENIGHNPNTPSNTLTYTYDATAPTVTSVVVPAAKYYKAGETLSFTVNFSENVVLDLTGGLPVLRLTVGTATIDAAFVSSINNSITFNYTVANGDMDMDGIAVNTLVLNGATIKDAATNNANITLNNIGSTGSVRVNTSHPSTSITSTAPPVVNAPFNATINFSESVTNFAPTDVTVSNGVVQGFTQITGSTYLIQVAPTAEGTVTVNVAADVADNIGGNGNTASNTISRVYDVAPPTITAVNVPADGYYKAGAAMTFGVRFSEDVILNTTNGTPYLRITIGSTIVNAPYVGLNGTNGLDFGYIVANGDLDLNGIEVTDLTLNNATIIDAASNPAVLTLNGVGNTTGVFVDATIPTVTSVAVPTPRYYREAETLSFTVNFSEDIILDRTGGSPVLRLTVGTATIDAAYVSANNNSITFSYTVANGDTDMDGIAVNALVLNGAIISDAATNFADITLNGIGATGNVRVNTSHPSVAITSAAPAVVNAPFTATVNFSESVTNFAPTDITVSNGAVQGFTQISGSSYLIQIAPTTDGTVTVSVAADVAENIGANGNTASNLLSRIYDVAPPSVTAVNVPVNGFYKAGNVMDFTVRFSENITLNTTNGTPSLSILIGTNLVQTTYTGLNGTDGLNFSYTVVDGDMDMDGIEVGDLTLNNATIFDIANNAALLDLNGVDNTSGVFVNTQHPSVTLSATAPALVNTPFTVTVTFSESVTGLATSDFTVTNATVSNITGSNATYTVLVTPATDGAVSISLPADAAVNIGDNGNTASTALNFTYDGTVPAVTAVAVPPNDYYNAGTIMDFIVRFNEDLVINTTGGTPTLTLNIGGTNVAATYTGTNGTDGLNFSYTVLDGQMDMDGIQIVSLNTAGSTIRDAATNDADLTLQNVGNTTMVRVNTTHPSVAISTPSAANVNTPFTVNIAFSENVTGFTSADVTVTNATVSPVTVIDNAHYSVTVVPIAEGPVTVNVAADVAENIGYNGNTASNTLNIIYDITGPAVASVTVPADKYYRAGEVLNFKVNFDEDIILNTTGGNPYLTLTIGTATVNATYTGVSTARELNFSYTVVNGDEDMDGIQVGALTLNGSTITDAATNNADVTLINVGNTTQVKVNTTSPGVTLTSTANALLNAPFTVTATFIEAVTVLTESDFSVTNGTVSGLSTTDNTTYTVTVTPAADGVVSIQIPANAVVNVGGNSNTPSNTLNFTYDGTKPTVNAVLVPINGYYKAGDVLNFTVFFNENINFNTTGTAPYLNVVLCSGTVKADYTVTTANSLSFSYTVQPGDMDLNGIELGAAIVLNGTTIKDDATNDAILTLNNVGNMSQVFVHTGSPSVQLSTTAAARVNAPFTVTAVFNEAVTGLAAGDFTITNGTAGTLSTADNITYTLIVTPAADGAVTVQLPAAQAQNIVSNNNTASNTLTVTYDATAPVIDGGLTFQVLERSAVGTQVGKATATDVSGIFQNWTITSDDSNGAFSIDANGNIQVADQAKLNAKVSTTVTLTITVSDGLNTSVAVPVTIEVKMVNQSPTLNAINDVTICPDGQPHTIQTEGASAVEAGQTYGFNIITDNPGNFDQLSVSAAGLITYQLKTTATGTSTVTVTIKDDGGTANGGTDTLRRSFSINVATLGTITITSDKGNSISKGDIVHLTATGGATYQWDNADGILSGQQSDVLEARPMQNTTYHVTARSAAGCTNTADFTVTIVADFKVDATNMLTPNGDGKNDKWVIRNLDSYPNNEVTIFDRSGRMVYTRKNYSNDWDGTMNGSPLAEGTYYYVLTIEGGAKTAKGFITIIRDRN